MKPLYLTEPVRKGLGGCLRPGGETLTKRAIDLLHLPADSTVLDAGCGVGTALSLLRQVGVNNLFGVDIEPALLHQARQHGVVLLQADLFSLPFADHFFDTIFCECVWNLTQKDEVLAEFHRVLRPGGTLVLSDIYLRAQPKRGPAKNWPVRSCFSRATELDVIEKQVEAGGFQILLLEDHAPLLKQTAAEFIFAHGSLQAFWQAVTGDETLAACACDAAATTRPSLFLMIAKRGEEYHERIRS